MDERAVIYSDSQTEVASFIERMARIEDFSYVIGDGQNGAEKGEILCNAELASLLKDMYFS